MYGLVDATSFYASAEKVFDPSIRNKPVVVLTNNDGCICAVCPIAKRLGIPKFTPYFQIKDLLHKHGVVIRSSNYELYADLSERMMTVISRYCDNQHIYSIDESFLYFNNFHKAINSWFDYGHQIRKAIWKETRLPVGVGFGITATLAKAANHASKKLDGFDGVAVIDSIKSAAPILQRMNTSDVWGIGSRITKKLAVQNIHTAFDLAKQNPKDIRQQYSVVTERTVNELNGISCLSWDDVKQPKQAIFSTRSFGLRINDHHLLHAALASHASIVAKKLRRQSSQVKKLMVFASNSPHDDYYYKQAIVYSFAIPTDNTTQLAQAVSLVLPQIYQSGVNFYRCGVGAIELASNQFKQGDLFNVDQSNPTLMQCFDSINKRYGDGCINIASAGQKEKWNMKRNFLSPQFTTNWRHIPKINC
ncbi:Y-family DNA polymerase [Colwellia sp. MSW7]|uniref:Y-family DNA polymerase n=1 Tax=Colwellia maritima TaxID=2912588 RepID=A0ABS9X3G5_9GAMM|nr:Y-family DNA polymerase [Colwellia maritima]MCI2284782.1 Y-family DNA polymerase [Colwellia maritima]